MSDYDDALDAMTKVVTRTKYSVFQPPEVYADALIHGLVELGFVVKPWREVPDTIKDATRSTLSKYRDAIEELA